MRPTDLASEECLILCAVKFLEFHKKTHSIWKLISSQRPLRWVQHTVTALCLLWFPLAMERDRCSSPWRQDTRVPTVSCACQAGAPLRTQIPSSLCTFCFWDRVCLNWAGRPWTVNPPASASQGTETPGLFHQDQLKVAFRFVSRSTTSQSPQILNVSKRDV